MHNIAEDIMPVIAIIFTFGIPGILIFWGIWVKHKERMKLMDMGMTPQEARDYFKENDRKPRNPYSSLKWGILLTMVGLGLLLGYILEGAGYEDDITAVTVLIFAGLGFLIYYIVMSSRVRKEKFVDSQIPKN